MNAIATACMSMPPDNVRHCGLVASVSIDFARNLRPSQPSSLFFLLSVVFFLLTFRRSVAQ